VTEVFYSEIKYGLKPVDADVYHLASAGFCIFIAGIMRWRVKSFHKGQNAGGSILYGRRKSKNVFAAAV
jgi:hypothetical protein